MFPTHKLTALADLLRAEGVEPQALLQGSGISLDRLDHASTRVTYSQMRKAYANAIALSRFPEIGLLAGNRIRLTGTGFYGYALISSPTVRDACDFALRYYRILGPTCSMTLDITEQTVVWQFEPVLSMDPTTALYRFCAEMTMGTVRNLFADLFGPDFRLERMTVSYADPGYRDRYASVFDCPVHFGDVANTLVHSATWMDHPLIYGDRMTHAMMLELCGDMLERLGPSSPSVSGQVRHALVTNPGRFLTVAEMAAELAMSERTLRRRLGEEKTSYQELTADVKAQLAIRYLRTTTLTVEDIAERLGYSEAGNFRHAFKRWTGKAPGSFRR